MPMEEEDPRFLAQPNFYFNQEDLLFKWAKDNNTEWNVTRPGFIIGAVSEAAMNLAWILALYAAIQKELGQPLNFPGDIGAWEAEKHNSAALLIGYHAEWVALTPAAANQAFNITDSSVFSYGKLWPVLAALYGIPYGIPEADESKYQTTTMPVQPPPRGFGPAGIVRASWSFDAWARTPEVQQAWSTLKERHGLSPVKDPFVEDNIKESFGLLDGEILGSWGRSMSMAKSRKLGWHGFVDSYDALIKTFEELSALKLIPPFEKPKSLNIKYVGY